MENGGNGTFLCQFFGFCLKITTKHLPRPELSASIPGCRFSLYESYYCELLINPMFKTKRQGLYRRNSMTKFCAHFIDTHISKYSNKNMRISGKIFGESYHGPPYFFLCQFLSKYTDFSELLLFETQLTENVVTH